MIMLLSVAGKNGMYIETYGLTYKRIGIYVYVLLTLIGLITTAFKIAKIKNGYYLIKYNGWSFLIVLVLATAVNWDQMIVKENNPLTKDIDVFYLLSLSNQTIPELEKVESKINDENKRNQFKILLEKKKRVFMKEHSKTNWKSSSFIDSRTYEKLK